jgi:hypothetical protein
MQFRSGSADDAIKCASCIEDSLWTVTVNGIEADAIACCGCLLGDFGGAGLSDGQVKALLTGNCKKQNPVDGDDDV